jgi:hypothetical protein
VALGSSVVARGLALGKLRRFAEVDPHSHRVTRSGHGLPQTERNRAMPDALEFILYLAAFLCFLLAAFAVRASWAGRINLIGLGLACWVFIPLVAALRRVS